jgi:hypothetical protein
MVFENNGIHGGAADSKSEPHGSDCDRTNVSVNANEQYQS